MNRNAGYRAADDSTAAPTHQQRAAAHADGRHRREDEALWSEYARAVLRAGFGEDAAARTADRMLAAQRERFPR